MDYLDRFFEPPGSRTSVAIAEPRPEPAPATGWSPREGSVVAMEPRPDPPQPHAHAADRSFQPGPVVAMEPRPDPPPSASAALDGGAKPGRARAVEPRPEPLAGAGTAAAAAAPQADPEARTRMLVRQNPWLTRFWMELTPAQQSRVERQLRRGDVVLAVESAEPAAAWDSMGLADRARLVFGNGGQPLERPAPPERRDGSTWARSS